MSAKKPQIAVLAGNPLIDSNPDEGLRFIPQLGALIKAAEFVTQRGRDSIVRLFLLFDHKETFEVFLANSDGINENGLTLAHMLESVRAKYYPILSEFGISPSEIVIVTESAIREYAFALKKSYPDNAEFRSRAFFEDADGFDQPNCKGVVAAAVHYLAQQADEVEVFVEKEDRCRPNVFRVGAQLAKNLGLQELIRVNMISETTIYKS